MCLNSILHLDTTCLSPCKDFENNISKRVVLLDCMYSSLMAFFVGTNESGEGSEYWE